MDQCEKRIPPFCDLHVDVWDKMPNIVSHRSFSVESKFLAYDQFLWACGVGTGAICFLLQDSAQGTSNYEYIRAQLTGIRRVILDQCLLSTHLVHLRVEFLDATARKDSLKLVDEFSDIIRIVSLVDHMPGYRQYKDSDQWFKAYGLRFGFTSAELQTIAERRMTSLSDRDVLQANLISELRNWPLLIFSHDDEKESEVGQAKSSGVSCVEFPLNFEAVRSAVKLDIPFLVGSPNIMAGKSSFGNSSAEAMLSLGGRSIISGDYVPPSTFLSLVKVSKNFSLTNEIERFLEMTVFEPARLLAEVGVNHSSANSRRVRTGVSFSQLSG